MFTTTINETFLVEIKFSLSGNPVKFSRQCADYSDALRFILGEKLAFFKTMLNKLINSVELDENSPLQRFLNWIFETEHRTIYEICKYMILLNSQFKKAFSQDEILYRQYTDLLLIAEDTKAQFIEYCKIESQWYQQT